MAHNFWAISGQSDQSFGLCACPPLVSYSLLLLRTIASKLSMSASYITTMLSCINFVVLHEVLSLDPLYFDDFLKFLLLVEDSTKNSTYTYIFMIEMLSFHILIDTLEFGLKFLFKT